jgi:hypothetical protein
MVFKFRDGGTIRNGVTAEDTWRELQRIAAEHGGELKPGDAVEEAEPEDAVLHNHFEWDDSVAAHEHRLGQARQLIRSVVVVESTESTEPIDCMVNIRVDDGRAYKQAINIATNTSEVESARQYLLGKQEGALKAFEDFERIVRSGNGRKIQKAVKIAGTAVREAVDAIRNIPTPQVRSEARV